MILQSQKLVSWKIFTLQYLDLDFRFSNASLTFLTFITEMSKRKHGKDLFSFGFKKETPEKVSSA